MKLRPRRAVTFVVERRYVEYRGKRPRWTPWRPQFEVRDVRTHDDYSPQFQIRRFIRALEEKYAQFWSARIRENRRPLGSAFRLRLRRRKARGTA